MGKDEEISVCFSVSSPKKLFTMRGDRNEINGLAFSLFFLPLILKNSQNNKTTRMISTGAKCQDYPEAITCEIYH